MQPTWRGRRLLIVAGSALWRSFQLFTALQRIPQRGQFTSRYTERKQRAGCGTIPAERAHDQWRHNTVVLQFRGGSGLLWPGSFRPNRDWLQLAAV